MNNYLGEWSDSGLKAFASVENTQLLSRKPELTRFDMRNRDLNQKTKSREKKCNYLPGWLLTYGRMQYRIAKTAFIQ